MTKQTDQKDVVSLAFEPLVKRLMEHADPRRERNQQLALDLVDAARLIKDMHLCIRILSNHEASIKHIYEGKCPDETDLFARDEDCPACQVLLRFSVSRSADDDPPSPY